MTHHCLLHAGMIDDTHCYVRHDSALLHAGMIECFLRRDLLLCATSFIAPCDMIECYARLIAGLIEFALWGGYDE